MRRGLLLAGLLAWAAAAQANPVWDSLWRTPDQRAEQLLRKGKAAEAARLFRDPRHKAYAELQAGNFAQAAQDFAAFGDSDSQYNRGNALARAGRLQEAIQAYDTALARDPKNRDARHNRDLVAQALRKPPPRPQSASGKDQPDNRKKQPDQGGQNGENGQKQGDQGKQDQSSGTQNGNASKSPSSPTQPGKPGQDKNGGAQANRAGQGQSPSGQQRAAQGTPMPAPDRGNASANARQQPANDAVQARHDAAAALAAPQPGQQVAPTGTVPGERQLAEEQWLRRIPDDPGGLLRRKFLIEHLIRQQGTQP